MIPLRREKYLCLMLQSPKRLAVQNSVAITDKLLFPGRGPVDAIVPGSGDPRQTLTALAPHVAIVPGLAIVLTVLGLNLLGDGLRDALDPRRERAR